MFWAADTARVCTMLLPASAVSMALCQHIAEERRRFICSTHRVRTVVVMCSVDVFPVKPGIAFTAAMADTSSARTSQCTVGGFTTCGRTWLGLSLILFSQSSMSRQQLMSISSLTAKFACKFTYFAYFAYTAYWLHNLSLTA